MSNASVPRTPDHLHVLKDGDSFVVADTYGDIAGSGDGFFLEDTRLLSCFYLVLGGERPTLLSSAVSRDNVFFTAHATNRPLPPLGDESLPQGVVHIERRRLQWDGLLRESITLRNYGIAVTRLQLTVGYGADFSDTFEVRGERGANFCPPRCRARRSNWDTEGWMASSGERAWCSRSSPQPSTRSAAASTLS
uniref:glycogen debranching N-terminal domain-containing protein n=1 Tax=Variovorax gracilis TaxID=3053502 RepID=UPI00336C0462